MDDELIERIVRALCRVALKRTVLGYQRFHELCGPGKRYAERYEALEKAVASMCDLSRFDYGVLLALDSGLPGDDYFRRFYRYRRDEYLVSLGDPRTQTQSVRRKWALVRSERLRAYDDVRQWYRVGAGGGTDVPAPGGADASVTVVATVATVASVDTAAALPAARLRSLQFG